MVWHIGFPKCGSTSLQHNLFARSSNINLLSTEWPRDLAPRSILTDTRFISFFEEIRSEQFDVNKCEAIWRDYLFNLLDEEKVNVISDEHILNSSKHFYEKILFLKSITPDASVFVVYREPHDILRSMYDYLPFNIYEESDREYMEAKEWLEACKRNSDKSIWNNLRLEMTIPFVESAFPRTLPIPLDKITEKRDEIELFFRLNRLDFDRFINSGPANISNKAVRKLARQLFKTVPPSKYLPQSYVTFLYRTLSKFVPSGRTKFSSESLRMIRNEFAGTYSYLSEELDEEDRS